MSHNVFDEMPRAFLVGVDIAGSRSLLNVEDSLNELAMLADTAGIHVIGQTTQRLPHPDPATFIRSGKVEEVRDWLEELEANMVIIDDELSPRHQRELEKAFGEKVRILDRTALILDIFAMHANTREGALQVELAQYEYLLPRLTRQWTHLARQAGGGAARGGAGGVGLRGPGETQLETDRRVIGQRISHLKKQIEDVRAHRERHRSRRERAGVPVAALVGYTNAGKSTLLNRLSGADVYVADQLFATLDTTVRRVELPSGRDCLFTDTVGFIQKLPTSLVAAFRATLEEITAASVLLHVVDCAHVNARQQIQAVESTLRNDLGIEDLPVVVIFNKVDLLDEEQKAAVDELRKCCTDVVMMSAKTGYGTSELLQRVEELVSQQEVRVVVSIPYEEAARVSRFYEIARVERERHSETHTELTGYLPRQWLSEYQPYRIE